MADRTALAGVVQRTGQMRNVSGREGRRTGAERMFSDERIAIQRSEIVLPVNRNAAFAQQGVDESGH